MLADEDGEAEVDSEEDEDGVRLAVGHSFCDEGLDDENEGRADPSQERGRWVRRTRRGKTT